MPTALVAADASGTMNSPEYFKLRLLNKQYRNEHPAYILGAVNVFLCLCDKKNLVQAVQCSPLRGVCGGVMTAGHGWLGARP